MTCFVCGEMGASVTCEEMGCYRWFHLPCAVKGGCVTCYLQPYSSFCWEHCPQQQDLAAPEDTTCVICIEPVEDRTSYGTMVCPACEHAWFHRACIQTSVMGGQRRICRTVREAQQLRCQGVPLSRRQRGGRARRALAAAPVLLLRS
ncbi:G2/M phase-specific E3 ubiquitin-protein ligase-like [Ara ararauna]